MITETKLKEKFNQLASLGKTEDSVDGSHQLNLCLVTINTLIFLGYDRENVLPISFEKFESALERYINSVHLYDDISYLICASFLKEYYLYRKYIEVDGFKESDVYRTWNEFDEFNMPISNQNEFFNYKYYKELKQDDTYLDSIYFCLSKQNNKFKELLSKSNDKKNLYLDEITNNFSSLNNKIDEKQKDLNNEVADFENKIEKLKNETQKLEDTLKKQKTAFNFVGLYDGFNSLSSSKSAQKKFVLIIASLLGISLVAVPILSIFFSKDIGMFFSDITIEVSTLKLTTSFSWQKILPIVGLEFILVYLFRVVLNRLNVIQTEVMQLELRKSLCQFIQSYAQYAKEIRTLEEDKEVNILEKFESIIFSNILSAPEKVPSTFDGLEQLANFIKEFKK